MNASSASSGTAASNSASPTPASASERGMPTSSSSASTRPNSRVRRSSSLWPPRPCTHAICAYFSGAT